MAATAGLYQVTKEVYLRNRINQVQYFAQRLQACGIATLSPPGGHAVFLDMDEYFRGCDRNPDDYASVGFTLELIKDYGIRAIEAGPFGWGWDQKSPEERLKIPNLVRFAVPRHVMADEHINYTVAAIKELHSRRHTIPNVVITRGKNMRLRHFSCGLKPVPVDSTITGTYIEKASRQLAHLSAAVGQDAAAKEQLLYALALTAGQWGQMPVPIEADLSGRSWLSHVSNDHSPFEYSVTIMQSTGQTELRFLIEAQPAENNLARLREDTLRLNQDIETQYSATVSLNRFNRIRDLFMPSQPDAEGKLVAWHSCALTETGSEWKIYLNPWASGKDKSLSVTREAFERLDMSSAWSLVEGTMSSSDSVLYFSLDLSSDQAAARVKVYIAHAGVSAAEIADKHSAICPDADAYEIQRFCRTMAGGSSGRYYGKSVISCFAFSSTSPKRAVGTVHFPIDAYAPHDAEVQGRIEQYYTASTLSVSPVCRERYTKTLHAVQRRPLAQGPGIHAWASLKMQPGGALANTFYFSPELFGPARPLGS